mmetsp:Transcript_62353/g.110812  ORF Transcript_62353/g.110812 Transcript_62353/m.110812 type:complete len:247 (-) Transcript_62353:290-1030(-)
MVWNRGDNGIHFHILSSWDLVESSCELIWGSPNYENGKTPLGWMACILVLRRELLGEFLDLLICPAIWDLDDPVVPTRNIRTWRERQILVIDKGMSCRSPCCEAFRTRRGGLFNAGRLRGRCADTWQGGCCCNGILPHTGFGPLCGLLMPTWESHLHLDLPRLDACNHSKKRHVVRDYLDMPDPIEMFVHQPSNFVAATNFFLLDQCLHLRKTERLGHQYASFNESFMLPCENELDVLFGNAAWQD